MEKIILPDVVVKPQHGKGVVSYQPMEARVHDLVHTKLDLSFDYQKQWVYGTAVLRMRQYAQESNVVALDAKGFAILRVAQIVKKDTLNLNYAYDKSKLLVTLSKSYGASDTFSVLVQYVAKPNELESKGGRAITDSRGLYFINPLGTDPNKPRQIWSQGETNYNSCWFPTIDVPNEKHTQDIYLTIDTADVSLSNGLLVDAKLLKNGKRVDHWQQLKPHAPYLTMIAIGNFVVTKDYWRNKEVSYYLEPAYAPYAQTIFGETPKMMETFSRLTGVDYPWEKFSQIVCRDFVSGAMENTSAVLHNEGVQHTNTEHLDNPQQDIIAHELFHHWFGNLVTCRSWSQLPLNESFATYGEYMYDEASRGKVYADRDFANNWNAYLRNKGKYKISPIRNYYTEPDEVFDVVSYQKGSWILHYLRYTVGDTAFFKGMQIYLSKNAFQYTDMDHLRHAMEEASGKDLQQFFKEWFDGFGHPILDIKYLGKALNGGFKFGLNQVQDSGFKVFHLSSEMMLVLEQAGGSVFVYKLPIVLNHRENIVEIAAPDSLEGELKLLGYWIDPTGNLPAVIKEEKSPNFWLNQLKLSDNYLSKIRSVQAISELDYSKERFLIEKAVAYCLDQPEYFYQMAGISMVEKQDTLYPKFARRIEDLALHGLQPGVRDDAIYLIAYMGDSAYSRGILLQGLNDISYKVKSTSLQALAISDLPLCLEKCREMEQHKTALMQRNIAWLYAAHAVTDKNDFFAGILGKYGFYRNSILSAYGAYLKQQNAAVLLVGLQHLAHFYLLNSDREKGKQMLNLLKNLEAKSMEKAVFKEAAYVDFYAKVLAEVNGK
ncbi:MAG: M1 family metallopeptidase [bacterium]|nr:M1 family metallopeptidase [bacterium]